MKRIILVAASLIATCSVFAADMRHGTYRGRRVTFENIGGAAIYQGDIILGETAEVESEPLPSTSSKVRESSTVTPSRALWTNRTIPYTVDSTLPAAQKTAIQQAIAHWMEKTPLTFVQRGGEANYVRFTTNTNPLTCSSSVGMIGGQQSIRLADGCTTGPIIHEIGHAVGLWHEQERNDRNRFITVVFENIDKAYWSQFEQLFDDGKDTGSYDYYSIMQYGPTSFSKDGLTPAMETVPAGMPLGQRVGLSASDIDSVKRLYGQPPTRTTIATAPSGLQVRVDGVLVDDGTSFDWSPGSTHTLEAAMQGDDQNRYTFGVWSDNGSASHSIKASADRTVYVANFIVWRKVIPNVFGTAGSISITPSSPDGFYLDRSYIYINATPGGGSNFLNWSITPSRSLNPKFVIVDRPLSVNATFTASPVTTITSKPVGRLMIVDGGSYSTPVNFAWKAGEVHSIAPDTTQPDFIHYRFTGWDDNPNSNRTITANGQPTIYTGNYVTQYSLSLNWSPRAASITAVPSSPDGFYDEGTDVQLTASEPSGYGFYRWEGDLGGDSITRTLKMDDEKMVAAWFILPSQRPSIIAVNSASSYVDALNYLTAMSPGEVVTIYGSDLGPANLMTAQVVNGSVTKTLGGTRVLFDGVAAPIVYTSAKQVSAIVPYEVGSRTFTNVQIEYNGRTSTVAQFAVIGSQPGIFTVNQTGTGPAVVYNSDNQLNTPDHPAARGSIVAFWVTGEGAQTPAPASGEILSSATLPKPVLPVSVRVGGQPAVIHYAGASPFNVAGVMQVNVQIPDGILPGSRVPISLSVGDQMSPVGVTIAVK